MDDITPKNLVCGCAEDATCEKCKDLCTECGIRPGCDHEPSCPNKAEKDYEQQGTLSFSLALKALKDGRRVTRPSWIGKDKQLELVIPKKLDPYFQIKIIGEDGAQSWEANQADILAEDWVLVKG